eukprot:843001-Amphidinium_carterae.2
MGNGNLGNWAAPIMRIKSKKFMSVMGKVGCLQPTNAMRNLIIAWPRLSMPGLITWNVVLCPLNTKVAEDCNGCVHSKMRSQGNGSHPTPQIKAQIEETGPSAIKPPPPAAKH